MGGKQQKIPFSSLLKYHTSHTSRPVQWVKKVKKNSSKWPRSSRFVSQFSISGLDERKENTNISGTWISSFQIRSKTFVFPWKKVSNNVTPLCYSIPLHVDLFFYKSCFATYIYYWSVCMSLCLLPWRKNEAFQQNGYPAIATALIKESVRFENHWDYVRIFNIFFFVVQKI